MNRIFSILKKIIFSYIILYGYNLIAVNFNMVIPINLVTILLLTLFGFPSLVALVFFRIIAL